MGRLMILVSACWFLWLANRESTWKGPPSVTSTVPNEKVCLAGDWMGPGILVWDGCLVGGSVEM